MIVTAPLISVITPNRNSGTKFLRTIQSVERQDTDFEYLIIDGASNDESLALAHDAVRSARCRTRLISEPDLGVYDAMNKGVNLAQGRYLYFLGSGDILRPGALLAVARSLPLHNRGMLYGNVLWSGREYDGVFDWRKLCHQNICHQAIFYGRDVFSLCGGYNLKYRALADWEFNLRCFGIRRIERQYLGFTVADFESGGISATGDEAFYRDRNELIRHHLGLLAAVRLSWPGFKFRWMDRLRRSPEIIARLVRK